MRALKKEKARKRFEYERALSQTGISDIYSSTRARMPEPSNRISGTYSRNMQVRTPSPPGDRCSEIAPVVSVKWDVGEHGQVDIQGL